MVVRDGLRGWIAGCDLRGDMRFSAHSHHDIVLSLCPSLDLLCFWVMVVVSAHSQPSFFPIRDAGVLGGRGFRGHHREITLLSSYFLG